MSWKPTDKIKALHTYVLRHLPLQARSLGVIRLHTDGCGKTRLRPMHRDQHTGVAAGNQNRKNLPARSVCSAKVVEACVSA